MVAIWAGQALRRARCPILFEERAADCGLPAVTDRDGHRPRRAARQPGVVNVRTASPRRCRWWPMGSAGGSTGRAWCPATRRGWGMCAPHCWADIRFCGTAFGSRRRSDDRTTDWTRPWRGRRPKLVGGHGLRASDDRRRGRRPGRQWTLQLRQGTSGVQLTDPHPARRVAGGRRGGDEGDPAAGRAGGHPCQWSCLSSSSGWC